MSQWVHSLGDIRKYLETMEGKKYHCYLSLAREPLEGREAKLLLWGYSGKGELGVLSRKQSCSS